MAGYKSNTRKSLVILYACHEQYENEKKILFTIVSKSIKYLGTNLTNEV